MIYGRFTYSKSKGEIGNDFASVHTGIIVFVDEEGLDDNEDLVNIDGVKLGCPAFIIHDQ